MTRSKLSPSAQAWWRKRRLVYNFVLVFAGMSALTLLAVVLEFSGCTAPDIRSAPLKLVYLALGYAAAMGVANLLYSLGPRMETRLHPAGVVRFRRWTFGVALGVSAALPFAASLAFLTRCR